MLRIDTTPDRGRRQLVGRRLRAFNATRSAALRGLRDGGGEESEALEVYALDDDGEVVGGLAGSTWAGWLHVDLLWVDEGHRGAGLGRRLMTRAERIARDERGCGHARLETWGFQAPGFYQKLGYTIVGRVQDYPAGETDHLLVKQLTGLAEGRGG